MSVEHVRLSFLCLLAGDDMFFKNKPEPIPGKRLMAVLSAIASEGQARFSRSGRRPGTDRKATWAICVLTWKPKGRARGICIDVSETGARIRFRNKVVPPQAFQFVSPKLGLNVPARFVRQDGFDVSIEFIVQDTPERTK